MQRSIFFFVLLALFAASARAGLLAEPMPTCEARFSLYYLDPLAPVASCSGTADCSEMVLFSTGECETATFTVNNVTQTFYYSTDCETLTLYSDSSCSITDGSTAELADSECVSSDVAPFDTVQLAVQFNVTECPVLTSCPVVTDLYIGSSTCEGSSAACFASNYTEGRCQSATLEADGATKQFWYNVDCTSEELVVFTNSACTSLPTVSVAGCNKLANSVSASFNFNATECSTSSAVHLTSWVSVVFAALL